MVTTIHTTTGQTRTEDDRAGEVVSLFYVVPDDQLVPDLHPHLGAFRRGEHVFATGYLIGLLEAPCLTYLWRRARAGQTPVGTRVEVAHRAPAIPGDRLHVTARRTSTTGNRSVFAVTAVDQHGVLVADGHVTARLVDTAAFRARLRQRAIGRAA